VKSDCLGNWQVQKSSKKKKKKKEKKKKKTDLKSVKEAAVGRRVCSMLTEG
jgi:hypothetical protein